MTRDKRYPGWIFPTGLIGLCFLGFLLYSNALQAPFFFDDYPAIVKNPNIRIKHLTPESLSLITKGPATARPVAMVSFAANYLLHQYHLPGYHLINIAIHIAVALLVFLITRQTLRLCGSRELLIPVFATLLWMVHPLHTQSVTYIVQRMNSLATMFYLLSISFYIKARDSQSAPPLQNTTLQPIRPVSQTKIWLLFGGALIAALLGLATKPIVATLPFVLFFYECSFFQNFNPEWIRKKFYWGIITLIGFILIVFVFLGKTPIATILSFYDDQNFTVGQRLLTELQVIPYYLSLIMFPHPNRLNLLYDFPLSTALDSPPSTILALCGLSALVLGGLALYRKHKLLTFAIFWFLITLIIESSVIGLAILYDHRTYLPSIFPVIAITALLYKQIRPKTVITILCMMITTGVIWTYQRNHAWTHRVAFWQDNVAKSPRLAAAYNNLGMAQRQQGQFTKARQQFENALKLNSQHKCARVNLGLTLNDLGQKSRAIEQIQAVLLDNPDMADARLYLAQLLLQDIRINKAIDHLQYILSKTPNHPEAALCLSKAYNKRGQPDNAIPYLKKILIQSPDNAAACIALGTSYTLKNNLKQATAWLQHAIQIQPTSATAHNNLGNVMVRRGKAEEAQNLYQKALQYSPKYKTARKNLANLCARTNHIDQAIHHFSKLTETIPSDPVLLYKMGLLYEKKGNLFAALKLYQDPFNQYPASRPFLPAWTTVMP